MPIDALIRGDIDAARLRAHAAVVLPATAASSLVAVLAVGVVGATITPLRLWGWLAALVLVMAARLLVRRAHRRATLQVASTTPDGLAEPATPATSGLAATHTDWLRRYRGGIGQHGLVWGVLA